MTNFIKENFRFDGMYLMYEGDQGYCTEYYADEPGTHPTRVGTARALFIARFKYGNRPWKTWVNFLVKNFTVEEYATRSAHGETPVGIMQSKGFLEPAEKKECKAAGYPATVEGWKQMIADKSAKWVDGYIERNNAA